MQEATRAMDSSGIDAAVAAKCTGDTNETQRQRGGNDVRQSELPPRPDGSSPGPLNPIRMNVIDGIATPASPEDAERIKAEEAATVAAEKCKRWRWVAGPSQMKDNITGIDFMAAGKDLGYPPEEIQEIVDFMASENWVILFPEQYPKRLRLTGPGKRAIARFRLPKWRRWLADNYLAAIAIVIALLALAANVVRIFG